MTDLERRRLAEHDARMKRPARELFPRGLKDNEILCRGCGRTFIWDKRSGPRRAFCTSACRLRNWRNKKKETP